jgi:hypothetical protein
MTRPERILFVFLDGVGIGTSDPRHNPFFVADTPTLDDLSGGEPPSLARPAGLRGTTAWFPLDASLDVEGTPQSGTGQSALLTGFDAGAHFGGHFGPWVPVRLRPIVEERSVLRRAAALGSSVAFANAYPRGWPGPGGSRRVAGPPLAARGAGVLNRHEDELARGEAVSSEIVNRGWREALGHTHVPEIEPPEAGRNLAQIAEAHELTLYAHYATDTAGHTHDQALAVAALERVDAFLAGVLESLSGDTLLLVASDHGNLEDTRVGHTRNPVLGLARGPGAAEACQLRDLREVAPFVLGLLGGRRRHDS